MNLHHQLAPTPEEIAAARQRVDLMGLALDLKILHTGSELTAVIAALLADKRANQLAASIPTYIGY